MEDRIIVHQCEVCGNKINVNCTTGEVIPYTEDCHESLRLPGFGALTIFREHVIKNGISLFSDYKWHLLILTEVPNPEEELLGWKYFSQSEKDITPLSTKLNLGIDGYYFDEVHWEGVKEKIFIESVMLFDHTLDIPVSWCPVGLAASVGGNITITQMTVNIGG